MLELDCFLNASSVACLSEKTVQPFIVVCCVDVLSSCASNAFSSLGFARPTACGLPLTLMTAMSSSEPAEDVRASKSTPLCLIDARSCCSARGSIGNLCRILSALDTCADEESVSIVANASALVGTIESASLDDPLPPPPQPAARTARTATPARRTLITSDPTPRSDGVPSGSPRARATAALRRRRRRLR